MKKKINKYFSNLRAWEEIHFQVRLRIEQKHSVFLCNEVKKLYRANLISGEQLTSMLKSINIGLCFNTSEITCAESTLIQFLESQKFSNTITIREILWIIKNMNFFRLKFIEYMIQKEIDNERNDV